MKRGIFRCETQGEYRPLRDALDEGWILDPMLTSGKPYILENATIWPLVFYENDEEKPKTTEEKKLSEFDTVESFKDVPNAEVDALLKQGYIIYQIFSKNTILLKRKEIGKSEAKKEETPQGESVQGGAAEVRGGL